MLDGHPFAVRGLREQLDGEPLTADDVIFSYNLIINEEAGLSSDRGTLIVNGEPLLYEKVDDLTFNVVTPARAASARAAATTADRWPAARRGSRRRTMRS